MLLIIYIYLEGKIYSRLLETKVYSKLLETRRGYATSKIGKKGLIQILEPEIKVRE